MYCIIFHSMKYYAMLECPVDNGVIHSVVLCSIAELRLVHNTTLTPA